jgi:hypothetical protein
MKLFTNLLCILTFSVLAIKGYSQDTTFILKNGNTVSGILVKENKRNVELFIQGKKHLTKINISKKDLIVEKELTKTKKPKNFHPTLKGRKHLISIGLLSPGLKDIFISYEPIIPKQEDIQFYGFLGANIQPGFDDHDGMFSIFQLGAGVKQYLPIINSKRYFITWGAEFLGTVIRSDFSDELNFNNGPNTYTNNGTARHNFIAGNLLIGQEYWVTPRFRLEFANGYGYKLLMNYSWEEDFDGRSIHSFVSRVYREQIRVNTIDLYSPFSRLTFTSTLSLGYTF